MTLSLHRLAALRPQLYHLTARSNLPLIEQQGALYPSRHLMERAGQAQWQSLRRREHLVVETPDGRVLIRDQTPLRAGHIDFEPGWTLERFVAHVNEHVFFWPGNAEGPIPAGLRHFERYAAEQTVILRLPTHAMLEAPLRFSRSNSGAPRTGNGRRSPRGAGTYRAAEHFAGPPSDVVEVVVPGPVALPVGTEVADSLGGPWRMVAR